MTLQIVKLALQVLILTFLYYRIYTLFSANQAKDAVVGIAFYVIFYMFSHVLKLSALEYVFKMLIKQGDIEKDEFEKVPAGIANKVEADKDAIIKDFSEHVQAKGSLKESSLTPEEQQRYNKIINEVAKYVKSEIEKL